MDRSGRTNLEASHPVRMMQPHAGPDYGMHFPLRPGTEVLIACVNGDPDRPIIVGTAPNPITSSPVVQPNQTQNVLRTGSRNEMVIEDAIGTERIRIHTPRENTTIQLGAVEEPEYGVLIRTDANHSEASRLSHNEASARKTTMVRTMSSLVGNTSVLLVGLESLDQAAGRGLDQPGAIHLDEVESDLRHLSVAPAERAEGPEEPDAQGGVGGGLWSELGGTLTSLAESAAMDAVRALARASDQSLSLSNGRHQGQPMGEPVTPAAVVGSPETAAVFARDRVMVYGDRVANLGSYHTASVVGQEVTEVKSPGIVEVAAGKGIYVTTPGPLDAAVQTARLVAGFYPQREPPALDDNTSIGIMARHDLKLMSIEHCILACAQTHFIAAAHEGNMKFKAKKEVTIQGASITETAGQITLSGGDILIQGGNITITASGKLTLNGDAGVFVTGAVLKVDPAAVMKGMLTTGGTTKLDNDGFTV
jgi:uncharacterized protein (DUF2345 family)